MTVVVASGDAGHWESVRRVWIGRVEDSSGKDYDVESSRSYGDRLVLKLEGIDGPDAAARLRGYEVRVASDEAPALPDDTYYVQRLVGLGVFDGTGRKLGIVRDVVPRAAQDLLVVARSGGSEEEKNSESDLLIPMTAELVVDVDQQAGRLTVELPEGLTSLNRAED